MRTAATFTRNDERDGMEVRLFIAREEMTSAVFTEFDHVVIADTLDFNKDRTLADRLLGVEHIVRRIEELT